MVAKSVVLLSGGLDSYTTAAIASQQGFALHALTVRYGQIHHQELEAAKKVADELKVAEHLELEVDLSRIGGSSLTGSVPVPKARRLDTKEIPSTYVPARNTVLLALALAWAEVLAARHIFIGVNALDYSGYPDCRPEFITAFEHLADVATKASVQGNRTRIHAPLINLTKAQIIQRGLELGLDYGLTHSCYDPTEGGRACGRCDSCMLRSQGFVDAGVTDPLEM
jgi:7-cyano-7-deazaguanine synthase